MAAETKTVQSSSDIPPAVPSGLFQLKTQILSGLVFLTGSFSAICLVFRDSEFLKPDPEYCVDVEPGTVCSRPELLAFQLASGMPMAYCGIVGFNAWHISRRAHTNLPQTPQGRLYGYLKESEQLAAVNFTFQFWDFFISLLIPEHRTAVMLMHHLAASTVCFLSLHYQVLHYYGVFFLGVTEFSSLFLVIVDLAKYFPPDAGTVYDTVVSISGPLFAISFTVYRVVIWWKVSLLLWQDCYHVATKGTSDKLRPGKNFILYIFLLLNIPLGILQLYWFSIILGEVQKVLAGDETI